MLSFNKNYISTCRVVNTTKEETLQLLSAYAAVLGIDIHNGEDKLSIWNDDIWFYKENLNHKYLYSYLINMGYIAHIHTDLGDYERVIVKYLLIKINDESEHKTFIQLLKETSWEQLIRWKLANQTPISQPNNKSFISTLFSWLTSERLFGNMNAALWFALKTWRQLRKRPLSLLAMGITMSYVLVTVLTVVM